jgi:hypothetical protein
MFEEQLLVSPLGGPGPVAPEPSDRVEAAYRALVLGVSDYAR